MSLTVTGDAESIVDCCPFVKPDDLDDFLTDMKRWEILARFHQNPVEGAELFAACGNFKDAAERLWGIQGANEEIHEKLHCYLLMVSQ